jgi:glycosyltransferase involved in cell wall biosynthesis
MNKAIHIMHVLGNLGIGGAEMGVLRLIGSLSNENMRHSIMIAGSDQTSLGITGANVVCHSLGIDGRSCLAFIRMARIFKSQRVDIVHVNNLSLWPDSALGALLARSRCLETFHGIEDSQVSFSRAQRILFRTAARFTSRMTAVAEDAAKLLAALTGIDRAVVQLIPNGIDTMQFAPLESADEKRRLRRSKQLPEESVLLGCVAGLRPVKNHHGLLQAFAQATRAANAPAQLVLVGDGKLAGDLMNQAKELGIQERVFFLGRRADVDELLRCFDVFVLNSHTEGLSYAMLEAMASGLPVVTTAVGANQSLIDSGKHGWLYPSGDISRLATILKELAVNPEVLESMGRAARKRVESEYGISRMADQYAQLYHAVMGKTR